MGQTYLVRVMAEDYVYQIAALDAGLVCLPATSDMCVCVCVRTGKSVFLPDRLVGWVQYLTSEPRPARPPQSLCQTAASIGVLSGCFARKIDDDPWFSWWFFSHLPGKPFFSPLRTPMTATEPVTDRCDRACDG